MDGRSLRRPRRRGPSLPVVLAAVAFCASLCSSSLTASASGRSGTVWAWGFNAAGQLGDGSLTQSDVPVRVHGLSDVTAVAGNGDDGYALKRNGTVWAWGLDSHGELGIGAVAAQKVVPVQVKNLKGVVAIAAGGEGSAGAGYALLGDGTVWAWGYGSGGALGNGGYASSDVPVQVKGLSGIKAIAAGGPVGGTAYALDASGHVWAWGQGSDGELGNGGTGASAVPVEVKGITGATAIAAGATAAYAVLADGRVEAWGKAELFAGQGGSALGNGSTSPSDVPVHVARISGIKAVAAGGSWAYALGSGGTVWAWGGNNLGDGSSNGSTTPVKVKGLSGVVALGSDQSAGIAVEANGTVWAWGNTNDTGEIGNADAPFTVPTPVEVKGLAHAFAVAPGAAYVIVA